MLHISQRQLLDHLSDVLRQAESGQRFIITVNGRPVAELRPNDGAERLAPASRLAAILADTPVDEQWSDDLRRQRRDGRGSAA